MGVLGFCPAGVGGAGTCAGQGGNKPRAGLGLPFEYRGVGHHLILLGTIWHY